MRLKKLVLSNLGAQNGCKYFLLSINNYEPWQRNKEIVTEKDLFLKRSGLWQ